MTRRWGYREGPAPRVGGASRGVCGAHARGAWGSVRRRASRVHGASWRRRAYVGAVARGAGVRPGRPAAGGCGGRVHTAWGPRARRRCRASGRARAPWGFHPRNRRGRGRGPEDRATELPGPEPKEVRDRCAPCPWAPRPEPGAALRALRGVAPVPTAPGSPAAVESRGPGGPRAPVDGSAQPSAWPSPPASAPSGARTPCPRPVSPAPPPCVALVEAPPEDPAAARSRRGRPGGLEQVLGR